jgi:hypothetical protein
VKEAHASVLEPHAGTSPYDHAGRRVVEGQRLMQAFPDVFLGWTLAPHSGRHYYVRQLHDMKGAFAIPHMGRDELSRYGAMSGWTLARAHSRTGDPALIAGYLGTGDAFDIAVAEWAAAYAEQNARDHAALVAAIDAGRV